MPNDESPITEIDRRTMLQVAGAAGVTGMAGCIGSLTGQDGTELRATLGADVKNLDPTRINDTTTGKATDLIYEGLTWVDFSGTPQPALATNIERNSNTEFSITLREGVQFHNGDEMTAEDVKFSFERYEGTPREVDVYQWYGGSTIEGDYSMTLTLSQNYAPLEFALSAVPIIPKSFAQQTVTETTTGTPVTQSQLSDDPTGTGPYEFDSQESGSFFRLTAFDDYWYDGSGDVPADPQIQTVTYRIIKGQSQQASALEGGDVDIINSPPAGKLSTYQDDDQYTVDQKTAGGFDMFVYPMHPEAETPFQNNQVRLGTNRLIPRDKIIETVYDGVGTPAYAPISPLAAAFTSSEFNQEMKDEYSGYDPQQAAEQLQAGFDEAGFDTPFSTTIVTNSDNQQRVDWAQLITEEMNNTEFFDVNLETLSFSTYVSRLLAETSHTENAIFAVGWSGGWDPNAYTYNVFHADQFTPACCNINHYDNQEVSDLLDQGLSTYDQAERQSIYEEAQRKVVADSPMAFTRFGTTETVANTDVVSGFETYPIDGNIYASVFDAVSGKMTEVNR